MHSRNCTDGFIKLSRSKKFTIVILLFYTILIYMKLIVFILVRNIKNIKKIDPPPLIDNCEEYKRKSAFQN